MDTRLRVKGVLDDQKKKAIRQAQFKVSAAKAALSGEMTVKDLSEELGIKDSTLRRWACEHEEMGDGAFPGNGSPKINEDYEIVKPKKKVEPGDPRLNLAERAFSVGGRNRLWVGDIAYMPASEGRLYLAAVIDAFSRKAVGRSMSERITEKVAIDAIGQAVGREGPPDDGSLVFHDGQGAQHASRSFQRRLDSHGMVRSASRPGTPPGNAVAESFFKTLKRELAEERSYRTRDEAKQDIFKYIELYCNRVRMHSTLGYMSPVEYERQYA